MRIARIALALALAAGLAACSASEPDPARTTDETTTSPDPSPSASPSPVAGVLIVPEEVFLSDIDEARLAEHCLYFVHNNPIPRWTAIADQCGGGANPGVQDTHTLAAVPLEDLRTGDLSALTDGSEFTTAQGLPAVTWRDTVWMATNEYSEWEEWQGLITVDPAAGIGNAETLYVLVSAKVDGDDGVPPVSREEFDDAVAALVVSPGSAEGEPGGSATSGADGSAGGVPDVPLIEEISEPEVPEMANDDASALAFTHYALDALNYAYASGDSSTLHEIYLPDASHLANVVGTVDMIGAEGLVQYGGASRMDMTETIVVSRPSETEAKVEFTLEYDHAETLDPSGNSVATSEGGWREVVYHLEWQGDTWRIVDALQA